MKQQRLRFKLLALFLFSLFALLAAFGGYSIYTYGNRWFAYTRNPRIRAQKENVIAGDVLDRAGVLLATTQDGQRIYQADEAARRAVVHLLGDDQGQVSNGVETFQSNYLYGFQASLPELVSSLFSGQPRKGDTVTLTIDSRLCTAMARAFDDHELTRGLHGAAVVINYKTGEVLGETSLPSFDPMHIDQVDLADAGQPFWNRVTQSVYPPGSCFKIVTTDAALTHLPGIQDADIACSGGLNVQGQIIHDYGGAVHNTLSLKRAFTVSCNNAYALLALTMKDEALRQSAESFGFNDNFLFKDIVVENSVYPTTNRTPFELAASGFGQSAIAASPMHMCLIAAAIANHGVMMEPQLIQAVMSPSGTPRNVTYTPRVYRTATTAANAATLADYMRSVVINGTGTRAAVNGLTVCGKTGSAESTLMGQPITYGWFVGYLADEELPFALTVLVEDIPDGEGGGSTAAPIAGDIFTYLKQNREHLAP